MPEALTEAQRKFAQSLRASWQSVDQVHPISKDPRKLFDPLGWTADPWQIEVMKESVRQTLILCPRQVGKSLTVAAKALKMALTRPGSLSVIISRSEGQAAEVLLKCTILHRAWLGELRGRKLEAAVRWSPRSLASVDHVRKDAEPLEIEVDTVRNNVLSKEFENGSRIETHACRGETAVGNTTDLLIIDEASKIPDPVYMMLRPTLAIAQSKGKGELLCPSTPFGKRGWWYNAWHECELAKQNGQKPEWKQVSITIDQCPRITPEFLESEKRAMGRYWYNQEYGLQFTDPIDSVFSSDDLERAMTTTPVNRMAFAEI